MGGHVSHRRKATLGRVATVALAALMPGCVNQGIAPTSHEVHSLYVTIFIMAGSVFGVVILWLLASLVLFRKRKGDNGAPPQREGRAPIVVLFFLIGLAIVATLFPFGE